MAYITLDFYKNDYIGQSVDEADFPRYEKRAAEVIDSVTGYDVKQNGLASYSAFIKEQVMQAVAAQVEFYVINGITVATDGIVQSNFSVGKVSIGGNAGNNTKAIAPKVYELLEPTGLLFRGL